MVRNMGLRVHDFWRYRRIFYKKFYADGRYDSSITLVNWPQIDYRMGPLVGVPDDEVRENLCRCKQLSHSFLYWMQTEAPRHDPRLWISWSTSAPRYC